MIRTKFEILIFTIFEKKKILPDPSWFLHFFFSSQNFKISKYPPEAPLPRCDLSLSSPASRAHHEEFTETRSEAGGAAATAAAPEEEEPVGAPTVGAPTTTGALWPFASGTGQDRDGTYWKPVVSSEAKLQHPRP